MAKEIEYLKCFFCGRSVAVSWLEKKLKPGFILDTKIYQIREVSAGPGRGKHEKVGGFQLVERKEWVEFERNYPELAANLKQRWKATIERFGKIME